MPELVETLPVEVETLPELVEVDELEVTPPVEVETPPVEVDTPPVLVETPPVDVETPLDYGMFSKLVLRAQHQIEGNNFDRRKTVLQYDEVLRRQREIIYRQRTDVLFNESIEPSVDQMVDEAAKRI